MSLHYRIDVSDTHAHRLRVTLTIPDPGASQTVSLPVWIPGSYMVREFGRHLSGLQARQGRHTPMCRQLDKTTWVVEGLQGRGALVLEYQVHAFDTSVRAAYLGPDRGFFNATSVCLRVHGREQEAHDVSLTGLPRGWDVATAMEPLAGSGRAGAAGSGRRGWHGRAADYDELVDHPFELGPFWRGRFRVAGVDHEFVVAGAWPNFDGERLLRDTRRICEAQIRFWHGPRGKPPYRRYVFMLNAVDEGYGGLEHRASTALIAARRDLPRQGENGLGEGYLTLLGLISHEFFHTWNVKRLKPASLCRIDYERENYTELLWFFEGFTSYYDDLMLVRAGLIDGPRHLQLLAKTASGVRGMPGRAVQSVAQASFDAWNKYYRQDENTANATVSYYTKGAQVALCLDLTLRREGRGDLDQVMRLLWSRGGRARDPGNIGITEADIAQALAEVGGRSFEPELRQWVHGTGELPIDDCVATVGLVQRQEPMRLSACWGMRLNEGPVTGCVVRSVLRGSAAESAGLCAGDEILAVQGWRVRRLDDAAQWLPSAGASRGAPPPVDLLVSRDQRVFGVRLQPRSDDVGLPTLTWHLDSRAGDAQIDRRLAWWSPPAP